MCFTESDFSHPYLLRTLGMKCMKCGFCVPGGLFDAEDDELELAFRIAVDWLNADELLLRNSRVIASAEKLHSEDTFKATRLCKKTF